MTYYHQFKFELNQHDPFEDAIYRLYLRNRELHNLTMKRLLFSLILNSIKEENITKEGPLFPNGDLFPNSVNITIGELFEEEEEEENGK